MRDRTDIRWTYLVIRKIVGVGFEPSLLPLASFRLLLEITCHGRRQYRVVYQVAGKDVNDYKLALLLRFRTSWHTIPHRNNSSQESAEPRCVGSGTSIFRQISLIRLSQRAQSIAGSGIRHTARSYEYFYLGDAVTCLVASYRYEAYSFKTPFEVGVWVQVLTKSSDSTMPQVSTIPCQNWPCSDSSPPHWQAAMIY